METRLGGVDHRVNSVEGRLGTLDKKVDGLADDRQSLARELSEFRGEMNGRLAAMSLADGAAQA